MVKSFSARDREFALAWNDTLAFPTVKDIAEDFKMDRPACRRKACLMRQAGVKLIHRTNGGYPRGGRPLTAADINIALQEDV